MGRRTADDCSYSSGVLLSTLRGAKTLPPTRPKMERKPPVHIQNENPKRETAKEERTASHVAKGTGK